jgi:hypothetical protein
MFQRFLTSLSSGQMTIIILSEALDVKISQEDMGEKDFKKSLTSATERQGFDFDEWKNRPYSKIC